MFEAQSKTNQIRKNKVMWSHRYICSSRTRKQYDKNEIRGMREV